MRTTFLAYAVVGLGVLTACGSAPSEDVDANEAASVVAPPCDATDVRDGHVQVVIAPDDGDGPLLALLDGAKRAIDVTIYQLSSERVIAALEAAAARGVRVRVIHDHNEAVPAVIDRLRAAGIDVHTSSPDFENTHQKTVIVDAEKAFVFSGNLDGRAFVRGRNYGVIDADAFDVGDLETVFEADWAGRAPELGCTRLVLSPINARPRVVAFVGQAQRSLDVEAMYITDRAVERAIVDAHDRGVEVRVLLNDPSFHTGDTSRVAARLAARGIAVKRSGPRFLHAKLLVADASMAFVGSENFSPTALDRNREAGVVVSAADADVSRIVATFASDWVSAPDFEVSGGTDPSR